jgi:isocitrate lyase
MGELTPGGRTRTTSVATDPARALERRWKRDPRWRGVRRDYSATDVLRLRGSFVEEHTLARRGAERLFSLLGEPHHVAALGAMTGGQAVQMVKAGLRAIYLSGWQVAADANLAGQVYPDQSLYPANSVPAAVRRINNALRRADQIHHAEGDDSIHWMAPIVADAEAGFGGPLNAFELMTAMIEAGAAGVHFEDQLASEKKCGHLGGKVLVPTSQFIRTLTAARLAADILDVPTLLVARTDSRGATLLTSDVDPAIRSSSPVNALPKDTFASGLGWSRRLHGDWRMHHMPICSGLRPAIPIWPRRGNSPTQSTPCTRARCSPTTAPRRSTGSATSLTLRLRASSRSWARSAIASSS